MNTEPVFAAIAHPVRRSVMSILLDGECTAGVLASRFEISRSAVSEHLGVLRGAGLVNERKAGRENFYSLNAQPLAELRSWLAPYESYWQTRMAALAQQLEEEQ